MMVGAGRRMPWARQMLQSRAQCCGWMNWQKDGVRDLSVALLGLRKSKGPRRAWDGSLRGMVSARAMYLLESGMVEGLNSTRSRYSMMPSGAVRYLCQMGHQRRDCSG
eukprot:scaffold32960_cov84-Amphora_coffeaeformis.AAC.1